MRKMRMITNKRWVAVVLVLVLLCGLATGCGAAKNSSDSAESYSPAAGDYGLDSYGAETEMDYAEEAMEEKAVSAANSSSVADVEAGESADAAQENSAAGNNGGSAQKLIKRYDYSYETEHFDEAYAYLQEQIAAYNGYVSSSEIVGSDYDSGYRTLYMTARIPAENSDAFVSGMGKLGTVVRQSESAEDVTLQYSDTESRIASLKTELESLNELLEQADSLETIVALQDRLTEVRYELESYQSKKKLYDNLISYSTVDITLEEVNYTVEVDDSTFFTRIVTGLKRSLRDIGEDLINLLEWIIINLPYFIVWGIIIFAIIKVVRFFLKRGRVKKQNKQPLKEQMPELNDMDNIQSVQNRKDK